VPACNGWRSPGSEVTPGDPVRGTANRLPRAHALRAADSLQLAAAVVAADGEPVALEFVCLDERLRAAARGSRYCRRLRAQRARDLRKPMTVIRQGAATIVRWPAGSTCSLSRPAGPTSTFFATGREYAGYRSHTWYFAANGMRINAVPTSLPATWTIKSPPPVLK
jgi:hypothetical protein